MYEREQALGKFEVLKKQIYELGIKAQAMVKEIQEETETFLSEKDFSQMDFKKVETLSKELQAIQEDFNDKVRKMKDLKDKFGF